LASGFIATVYPSTADIPAAVWNSLVPSTGGLPDNPFLDHAFFLALERSGCATARTGWQPQHILVTDADGTPQGLMPLFLKSHSMGEYVFDHAWANAFERAGGSYYPKLQCSVPFTPATAPKFLGNAEAMPALLGAAEQLAIQREASSVHATFLPEHEAGVAEAGGWLRRLDTLASRKRKTIRRERRDALADGLTVRWLTGSDLREEHWDAFFEFYEDTGSRKWGRPYLNRKFFSLIGESLSDRILLVLAYDGTTPIAGAINFIGADRLYGRNWGATRDVPFLHFEVCYYQAIEYAIAHKLRVVEAGAQGEHKLARGYVPATTHSVHWIAHPGLRRAVADHLEHERLAVIESQDVLESYTPFRRGDRLES
jgi:predicted N-acyltransferase